MANSRKGLPSSLKQLGRAGQSKATNLIATSPSSKQSLSINSSRESKSLSFASADRQATSIEFGKAHVSKTAPSTTSEWKKLVGQVASGSLSGFFGGSAGLLSGGGLGSLLSGIEGLFGGKKSTPQPLVAFQLPASQNQTISIGGQNTGANLQDHSSALAHAVKTALLQSSSLNDVIAEI